MPALLVGKIDQEVFCALLWVSQVALVTCCQITRLANATLDDIAVRANGLIVFYLTPPISKQRDLVVNLRIILPAT